MNNMNIVNDIIEEGEIAQLKQQLEMEALLQQHKLKMQPETHPDFDGVCCIDCGEEIPEERLNMKRIRCTHCQTLIENRAKRFAS